MTIDHVALLLRYSTGHLILFEATGDCGVILTDWHDFHTYKWHLLYDKIVYRKLNFERPNDMIERLETFIKVPPILMITPSIVIHWQIIQDQCLKIVLLSIPA